MTVPLTPEVLAEQDYCPVGGGGCVRPRGYEGRRRLPMCVPHWGRVTPASRAWWHCAMNVGTADDLGGAVAQAVWEADTDQMTWGPRG